MLIDVKNEEWPQFTPSGQIFVPNEREFLQKMIDFPSLSKSPVMKNTPPAIRPP
jgi:hypothetical protein